MSFTNQSKNSATMKNRIIGGLAQKYNVLAILYEMEKLYYNSYGEVASFTNQTVNSASITNQSKS